MNQSIDSSGASVRPLRSSGTLRNRRERNQWNASDFRLLSIDGGGIRGILPAAILAECEQRFLEGDSAGPYFDMIAGTSTGGIIALALSIGIPASEILAVYSDHGSAIFPQNLSENSLIRAVQIRLKKIRNIKSVRYDRNPLKRQLESILKERLLGSADRQLVIPSFDKAGEVNVFKTPHHPDYVLDWQLSMVDVALCTTAAPTFFAAHAHDNTYFMDGGVWANNPTMLGLVDALACHDIASHQIKCISLGCGRSSIPISDRQLEGGLYQWRTIFDIASDLNNQNVVGQARLLIGGDQILRLDADFAGETIELDDYEKAITILPKLAKYLVDENELVLSRYFDKPRPPYKAYNGPRLESELYTLPDIGNTEL